MLDGWKKQLIGKLSNVTSGGTPSTSVSDYWNGNILWMNSGELNNKKIYGVKGRITELGLNNSSTHLIPARCVLIGLAGQGKTRGTVAINYVQLCINQSIGAIYPSSEIFPEYLYYYLDSKYNYLRELSSGDGGRGGLNLKLIRNIEIEYPENIKEQKAIVDIICNIDNLIDLMTLLIEKKAKIMNEVVNKKIEEYSQNVKEFILSEICYHYGGTSLEDYTSSNGKYNFISIGNYLSTGKYYDNGQRINAIGKASTKILNKDDLVMVLNDKTQNGNIIGATILIDESKKYIYNQRSERLVCNTDIVIPKYLWIYLNSAIKRKEIFNLSQGGTQIYVNFNKIYQTNVFVPDKKEQEKFVNLCSNMDDEIEALKAKLSKYKKIKDGMIEDLLTGKVRLSYE